jgi:hypothetical protein
MGFKGLRRGQEGGARALDGTNTLGPGFGSSNSTAACAALTGTRGVASRPRGAAAHAGTHSG